VSRDRRNIAELESDGWCCEIIWECETNDSEALKRRLKWMLSH
jgi:G:T-mismatch repair DNA endonuclease (very short patch repair protein)